jgi:flagella basal body P-ring formation protein FlgA
MSLAAFWRRFLPLGLAAGGLATGAERVEVEVARDKITAGDLAKHISAWAGVKPETELGYAPLPGVERRVTRGQIVQWGLGAGLELDAATLPEWLIVSRKMRRLRADEAARVLRQAAAGQFQVAAESVQVNLSGFDEPLVPAGELSFALAAPLARLNEAVTLPLRWTDRDGRSGVARFRASVEVTGEYAVARAALARGTELAGEDVEFRSGALPGDPAEYLLSRAQVEGRTMTRSLKAGEVLQRRMLRATPDIERGDTATIEARFGAVLLRAPGRADGPGSAGDTIPCRNLESGRRITCRVIGPARLEAVSAQ